jgi:beta-galactosidase
MKLDYLLMPILLIIISSCSKGTVNRPDYKICIDENWQFKKGDIKGAEMPGYNDRDWRLINLPHDWSVEPLKAKEGVIGPFSKESTGKESVGHTIGGTAWYRRKFTIPKEDSGKMFSLYFEGVYMESEVYVNGEKVYDHPNGYTSFFCNIGPYCRPAGKENTIAVKVVNEGKNSRWYTGSGIYRHVFLVKTDSLHFGTWEPQVVTGNILPDAATVSVKANIKNEYTIRTEVNVAIKILNSDGMIVAEKSSVINLAPAEAAQLNEELEIEQPELWNVDSPNLYVAQVSLSAKGRETDSRITTFGIRSIKYNSSEGLLINGKPAILRGGCIHHDNGFLGSMAIDRAEVRKVELLKNNGFNAVRCAHNPPSEKFLEACDNLGLFVIDEFFDQWELPKNTNDYHRFFKEWYAEDVSSAVCRDRNHPSVIMWSIGNEIYEYKDSSCIPIARNIKNVVNEYDTTRPLTAAVNNYWGKTCSSWSKGSDVIYSQIDIAGYNYEWNKYLHDHEKFPDRVLYGSESFPQQASDNWNLVDKYPFIIGDFVWTAIDYLGESGLGRALYKNNGVVEKDPYQLPDFPWFNAWSGDIDFCGNKKPASYYRDVIWDRSAVEIFVHEPIPGGYYETVSYWGWPNLQRCWNWPGCEGQQMEVYVYTKSPLARLYLNGELIGEKKVSGSFTAIFNVRYYPGELKAVAVSGETEIASSIIKSAKEPASIFLTADRDTLTPSVNDLGYIQIELVDSEGILVANSNKKLKLELSGDAVLAGSGNASPNDMESFRSVTPKLYQGKAMVIIKPLGKEGETVLKVKCEGLPDAVVKVLIKKGKQ